MTPPNKLEETLSQVVKILRSRGCRRVPIGFIHAVLTYTICFQEKSGVCQVYGSRHRGFASLCQGKVRTFIEFCLLALFTLAESAQYFKSLMSRGPALTLYA
jgi:hypothetical protein